MDRQHAIETLDRLLLECIAKSPIGVPPPEEAWVFMVTRVGDGYDYNLGRVPFFELAASVKRPVESLKAALKPMRGQGVFAAYIDGKETYSSVIGVEIHRCGPRR